MPQQPQAISVQKKAASELKIHLLGPFRVEVDGRTVEEHQWLRPKAKVVIKLLALQTHHRLHREQFIELLWPDQEMESANNNLHKVIHLARRALEPGIQSVAGSHFILTHDQHVVLTAPVTLWIDVEAFEQAAAAAILNDDVEACEAALSLYSGDLLTEDIYQDWAAAKREHLRGEYQSLLVRLARSYESRGEHQRSIERYKELLESDSTNEEAHRQLMRLYAVTNNKHRAVRQFELCRDVLEKELDAKPDRSTVDLHRQIISDQIVPAPASEVERGPDPGQAISSIAILPLVNASSDPNTEYLSDGITESIINTLSQLPQLKVMARSTVFRYKGVEIDPQEAGRRMGVRAVLTGRVLHRGDALNIQTELVDVRNGAQLWGEKFNRNSSDIFEVQEEIAQEITEKLRLKLTGEERGRLTKRYTENVEAYQLYLKGRYYWDKRTIESVNKSIEYFQQAIEIDPDYAVAYTGLADAYTKLGDVGTTARRSKEAFSKGKIAAIKALEIDGTLAEAHTSLAHLYLHEYEWSEAEREFKRAIEINPNYATTHHWYAYYLLMVGRLGESLKEIARALELDPLSLPVNTDFGEILYFARRYDEALEQLRKTLEMDPYYFHAHLNLARVYEQKGMYNEAVAEFLAAKGLDEENVEALASLAHAFAVLAKKEEASNSPALLSERNYTSPYEVDVLASLGQGLAISDKRKEALSLLAQLKELSTRKYVSPYDLASVYLSLGEKDKALECLERAYEERSEWMIYLSVDPRFDSLRAEPRFVDMLRRIGFAP